MDLEGYVVVEVREGYTVLCTDGLTDDDLVDVIELIPVLISVVHNIQYYSFYTRQELNTSQKILMKTQGSIFACTNGIT